MQQSWISYFSNLVKQHGGINLAQGIPGFQPPQGLLDSLAGKIDDPVHQYAPGPGNLDLRKYIEEEYADRIPGDFRFIITNGGTEAIHLLYLYLHRGNKKLKAAAFSPVYESYIHLPRIHGDEFKSLQISSQNLINDIEPFFADFQPDVFFVNTPGNPYGRSLSEPEFNCLVQTAEKYNCFLIIDAVYDKFYFTDKPPFYPYNSFSKHVFYVNSFSKQYSITGWRIGYFFVHKSHFNTISDIHDYTGLCCPSVLQAALSDFLNRQEDAESYVKRIRSVLQDNFFSGKKCLEGHGFYVPETHGGYFIWTKLPESITNSIEFSKALYENTRTAVIPGAHFGNDYDSWIRINIARKKPELISGLKHISDFAKSF